MRRLHSALQLRNRKHVPCFYRVIETRVKVWENEKCCGNTSIREEYHTILKQCKTLLNNKKN